MLSVGGPTQTPRREEGALSISALSHPCKHMRRQNEDMHLKSASSSAIFQVIVSSFIAPIFLDSPIFSLWPIVDNIWKPRSLAYTVGLTTQKPMIDAGLGKTIVDTQGKKVNTWSLQCIKQMLRYYNFKVSAGNPFFSLHRLCWGKIFITNAMHCKSFWLWPGRICLDFIACLSNSLRGIYLRQQQGGGVEVYDAKSPERPRM